MVLFQNGLFKFGFGCFFIIDRIYTYMLEYLYNLRQCFQPLHGQIDMSVCILFIYFLGAEDSFFLKCPQDILIQQCCTPCVLALQVISVYLTGVYMYI